MNEFTYEEYKTMLSALSSAGYKFVGYHESAAPPTCMIRHDIDASVGKALQMSKIEQDLGIQATYCFMVRTDSYNVFSKKNSLMVDEILRSGHFLGLHFDCSAYQKGVTVEEIAEGCRIEAEMLETWFSESVELISYHKPNALVLGGSSALSAPRPHAYEHRFMHSMTYLSDSYGFWRFGHPLGHRALRRKESLNLGVHPIWWNATFQSALYSLTQAVAEKREEMREYMLTNVIGV